ncbi:O-antigen translocase [Psychroserpens sp. XS_ASV72]|uniref:O-antigen translocase n=1 Tax=Psychroserpens sp. XS_ASV72 TaxID=3241293 RepID=UPI003518C678
MQEANKSYNQIFKSTSLFGGVQVLNIGIAIIRSKVVALLIGPTGMGIIGLLMSTLKVIGEFTKLGLDTTAVREIALSNTKEKDEQDVSEVIATVHKVVWFTGALGILVTILLSPILSYLAFEDYNHTLAFIWISSSLLFNQLAVGKLSILQGFRKLKKLAKSNLLGNFIGLLVSLPLYYIFKLDAIVPVIIATSILNFFFSWLFTRKLAYKRVNLSYKQAFQSAKGMLGFGLMLSIHGSMALITAYVFQVYLSHVGGVAEVGFYLAGFMIINSYVGMVFNAMRTDYFPKLSGIIELKSEVDQTVSQQAVIGVLIIGPLVLTFLIFMPLIIRILYSEEFLVISDFLSWAILGILFKTLSWSIGYVILAKSDNKLFIKTGLFFNSLLLIMNITGYYFYGLEGVGISFLVYYVCHFIGLKIITHNVYGLKLSKELISIFSILTLLSFACFFVTKTIDGDILSYVLYSVLLLASFGYSYVELNKRINFRSLLERIFKRNND